MGFRLVGAEGQNRTADTTIFSRMLYQLSYLGTRRGAIDERQSYHGILEVTEVQKFKRFKKFKGFERCRRFTGSRSSRGSLNSVPGAASRDPDAHRDAADDARGDVQRVVHADVNP